MAFSNRLPSALASAFNEADLQRSSSSVAVLDTAGRILWVNDAWKRFAKANGMNVNCESFATYWSGMSPALQEFYRNAFADALKLSHVFTQEYECSSPEKRRLFFLNAMPISGKFLLVEHSIVAETDHDRACLEALEERYTNATGLIVQCSNCRRIRGISRHAWDWVPAWVVRSPPNTSHGLCPTCEGYYWGQNVPAAK